MKHKIGVFGSAEGDFERIKGKVNELGKELGKRDIIVITGASNGIPQEVALVAKNNGAEIWGFSPGSTLERQKELLPKSDTSIYDKLIYVPDTYEFIGQKSICLKYRNVTSTATCDAGIIVSGRWGTMNEFTNLYDMGKIIGVLTETGGVADELASLMKMITKPSKAKVFFDPDPKNLVGKIFDEVGN